MPESSQNSTGPAYSRRSIPPRVGRLRAFRGIDTLTAMTMTAELHDSCGSNRLVG